MEYGTEIQHSVKCETHGMPADYYEVHTNMTPLLKHTVVRRIALTQYHSIAGGMDEMKYTD